MGELRLVCKGRHNETADVITFQFDVEEGVLGAHRPGQAFTLQLPCPGGPEYRTFTIASDPGSKIEITVKNQGGATQWMHEFLHPGTSVRALGPVGNFSIAHHFAPKYALISGGSGATPMMSMLRWLAKRGETVDVVYIHASRTPADILFELELKKLDCEMSNLRLAYIPTTVPLGQSWTGYSGHIDRKLMSLIVPDLASRETFCCGPAGFMDAVEKIFVAEGGNPNSFHTEDFGPLRTAQAEVVPTEALNIIASSDAIQLTFENKEIIAKRGDLLLDAVKKAGMIIPTGCTQGVCGTCRVKVTAGDVKMNAQGGISAKEEREGYRLACCSRLIEDVVVKKATFL